MDTLEHLETFGYAIEENVIPVDECNKMSKVLDEIELEKRISRNTVIDRFSNSFIECTSRKT